MPDIVTRILSRYQDVTSRLPEKKGSLRFDRCSVSVSAIAQQFYCEKALEFSFVKPAPRTQKMKDGEAGHENVSITARPLTREEAIQEASVPRKAAVCIYEFSIAWEHHGVTLVGNVDEAWFREASVELVTERKFSGSLKIYQPYHVQAGLYCLGLGPRRADRQHPQKQKTAQLPASDASRRAEGHRQIALVARVAELKGRPGALHRITRVLQPPYHSGVHGKK